MIKIISIIIPTHNEAKNIGLLYPEICQVFEKIEGFDFELIFVDDSSDNTPQIILTLIESDERVNLIRLTRKFGQAVAITAGLEKASGVAAIMMDADLQDPPKAIPQLIKKWEEGNHIVYVKRKSEARSVIYELGAALFYKLLYSISDIKIPIGVGEFRLVDRKVLNVMNSFREKTRFLRGLTLWPGFSTASIEIERGTRVAGETNYNLMRSFWVAIDGFVSFSIAPLRAAISIGLLMFFLALVGVIYAIVLRLMSDSWVSGWTLMFVALMLMGGTQLIVMGVLGEYVGRIFLEVLDRPLYVIDYEAGSFNSKSNE
ncbi:glycosyltransferase family 2 protein [Polynucleobacter sp. AP-Elch-400A-B2]|uniref:glycosyltransferase family 2 protein n=1 Tax=Polynucleobacter sp. AP-Elch-400A-B2 TaxID=2576930 RepID=UPI001BFD07A9|nr:glycosyltransferase family 2 protein [Polynucleobacter sp. AP-Elch-400A-B2]QWE25000.1 glycosyltransferase family 2 protein [Polynucleobacter sp. AP-Elch-400A-B2]